MYTSEGVPEEAPPPYPLSIAPSVPLAQSPDYTNITNPSVFFKYCIPLENYVFTFSFPSLQQMIQKEQKEIIKRPKRAKCYFVGCILLLSGCIAGGITLMLRNPFFEWSTFMAICLFIFAGVSFIGLLINFRPAFISGHVKHAADIYYGKEIVGILFDIRDNMVKRVGYKPDYGMNSRHENEPLEDRISYLHEPMVKILPKTQIICRFDQLKNIGWQEVDGGSGSDTYFLILQYDVNNTYAKYKISDYIRKEDVLRGYVRLKYVMKNVNPTWFSSGQCVDKGEKTKSWKGRRR